MSQPATTTALPTGSASPSPDRFKRFDDLALKGWDIPYPKVADSILSDRYGVRDTLAEVGIGISPINTINFQYDFLQNDRDYQGRQLYNGQNITRTNSSVTLTATYDLGRIGIPDGQLVTTFAITNSSLTSVNGPNKIKISRLHYYQSILGGRIAITLGLVDNTQEFLGTNVGGNLATGNLGPQATIPFQVGLSYGGFDVPAINVRARIAQNFYNKLGVQRSLPPGGGAIENALNPSGFRFRVPGTGVLVIDEIGYKRASSAGVKSTWFRGGGIYNSTRYTTFDGRRSDNWAAFAAIDRQIIQSDAEKPYRGVYAGVTVNYAPPQQNLYTQYYEGRVYGIGLLQGRPFDLASLVSTYNIYSPQGLAARTSPGQRFYKATWALIASYAYRLAPGIYLQPGLGVTQHPIFSPRFGTALNGYLGLVTIF